MKKNPLLFKAVRRLPAFGALAAGAILVHGCTRAEAEPQPDPAEVQRFLAEVEAEHQRLKGEADAKKGHEKRLRNLLEGAATRAPSDASINKIERVVVGNLAG